MKMHTFARGFREMLATPTSKQLSFEDRVGLLVDQEWTERENRRVERRIKEAHLSYRAGPEEILCNGARGIDKSRWLEFTTCRWVRAHQNIIAVGPTGVGKSFVGNALAQAACRQGFRALLVRVPRLFEQLAIARASAAYTWTRKPLTECLMAGESDGLRMGRHEDRENNYEESKAAEPVARAVGEGGGQVAAKRLEVGRVRGQA